jgi:hypothetical protein
MFGGRGGKSRPLKSISNFCCCPNSPQKFLMAAARPRYSGFDECNSWDKDWTSVANWVVCFCRSPTRLRTSGRVGGSC